MSEPGWTLDPHGGLQQSQPRERLVREKTTGNRYQCTYPGCGESFMSDEALQLHRLYHALTILTATLKEIVPATV